MKRIHMSSQTRFFRSEGWAGPLLIGLGIFVVGGSLFSCSRLGGADTRASAGQQERPVYAVSTTRAVKGQIRDYLALSGDLVAGSTVDVYPDVAGRVTKLMVRLGDRVEKDQALLEVDPSRPGMNFVTSLVKAPIGGVVIAVPAQVGMTVAQSVPVVRLSASGGLEIKTYVAERFISKIRVGLSAMVTLDAYPGETFYGTVREVSPVVDPLSRTMEVRISVQNQGNKLKTGMFAKVRIITQEKQNVVKIPSAAVVSRYGEQWVFVVESDPTDPAFTVVRKRPIKGGILIDNQLEVLEGLAADEEIVIRGQTLLDDGARVNVVERQPGVGSR
ncbi:MAG TPA: efflux RND transporter periplasmic adaptor subunit [Termitinemataceae bacterium]|nr:efflux RND transporter periplasmic adaptor subunit [Termitinemataceae bacterium]